MICLHYLYNSKTAISTDTELRAGLLVIADLLVLIILFCSGFISVYESGSMMMQLAMNMNSTEHMHVR